MCYPVDDDNFLIPHPLQLFNQNAPIFKQIKLTLRLTPLCGVIKQ